MWLGALRKDSSVGNFVSGGLYGIPPAPVGTTVPSSEFRGLDLPSGVSVIKEKNCSKLFNGDIYLVGGFSHNLRVAKNFGVVIQGIRAPSNPLVLSGSPTGNQVGVTAVAGPGLTASVRVALAFWDDNTKETSAPSDPSAAISLVNQRIQVTPLPTFSPVDDRIIVGTSVANAATAIVGIGTTFTKDVKVGDKIAFSSAPTVFGKVLVVTDDLNLTVATAIGDGTSQTIIVRRLARWTHVRVLYSVDGNLFRVAAQREIGVVSITPAILTVGGLGEVYAEVFDVFPRCKFNEAWNGRQVLTGDEQNPKIIYFSLVDLPERRSTISLNTKDAKDVTALFNVNDNLMVTTSQSWQIIRNASSVDDIAIDFLDPELGVICNAVVQIIHGNAWVYTNLGRYLCDGSSIIPMNKGDKRTFTNDLAARPEFYEDSFAIHDPRRHTYQAWAGKHPKVSMQREITPITLTGTTDVDGDFSIVGTGTLFMSEVAEGFPIAVSSDPNTFATVVTIVDDEHMVVSVPIGNGSSQTILKPDVVSYVPRNAYLVANYGRVIPQEGGQLGQPQLSWDVQAREEECAALLGMPGSKHGEVFTGACDGFIYRHNVDGANDPGDDCGKEVFGLHGADAYQDEGGDSAHGKTFKDLEFYADSEDGPFDIELYPGDEFAYPDPTTVPEGNLFRGPIWTRTRGLSAKNVQLQTGNDIGYYEPRTVWVFNGLEGVSGRRLSLAFRARNPGHLRYRGHGVRWMEGPAPRRITRILRSE